MITFKVYFRFNKKADSAFVTAVSKNAVLEKILARFPKAVINSAVQIDGRRKAAIL